jgi:hypothetical protein
LKEAVKGPPTADERRRLFGSRCYNYPQKCTPQVSNDDVEGRLTLRLPGFRTDFEEKVKKSPCSELGRVRGRKDGGERKEMWRRRRGEGPRGTPARKLMPARLVGKMYQKFQLKFVEELAIFCHKIYIALIIAQNLVIFNTFKNKRYTIN